MQVETVLRVAIGVAAGGLVGFGLYRVVGCSTGACPLTSNPYISVLYGMFVGFVLTWR